MDNGIVITGLGVIAPNGIGKEKFWDALKEGKSGIKPVKRFDTQALKCSKAGEIQDFKPEEFLGKKGLRDLDRSSRLLCSSAGMAIEDAGLKIDHTNTDDIGVCTGTTLSSLWNYAEFDKEAINEGPLFTDVALFPGTVMNAASSQVSIKYNIQGFNTTISTGFSSSIDALKYAIDFIKLKRIKAVLVGGVESLSPVNYTGFYRLGYLAGINGEEISCPFDKRRNGIIVGEGAAVVVIENEEYAKERGARIYARVNGIGNHFEAFKMGKYHPEATGLKASMKDAMKNSELDVSEIDYIGASANSVPEQDRLETKAIKDVYGKYAYNIPVSSIKSMIGETFSAGGLFQISASIGSMYKGFIPPTMNYEERDDECDLDYVANRSRITRINNVLINNYGPGGSNAAFILSKWN
ncbi:3-oxoacyl-[acyl-carrier-protein] synthase 2 [bacterium BMS3Abin09]|nr:3-oxoacyl-[acyl-carrier-protein] synthase 2 [bacterium BMS3Abin09]HDH49941.1 beta-ketoacyl-[acyl-carrier-protein] synthase family protein [Nitrospirota bacterium]